MAPGVGVKVGGRVSVAVGVGGPRTVTPAEAVLPRVSVTVIEKSPIVLPAVKTNEPPDVGTLATLAQPPPADTENGALPPVTTKVCVPPLHVLGGAPVPADSAA